MVVEDKYEVTAHESTKDGSSQTYSCKHRRTQKVKCHGNAKVVQFNNKWLLQHADDHHHCEPNRPKVIAVSTIKKFKIQCRWYFQVVLCRGYWVPTVWGWLPDKCELSYKVFFLLIDQKMLEFGFKLNISSVFNSTL